jgi:DNA polymerase
MDVPTAAPFVPAEATLAELRSAAPGCRGCDLYRQATQVVFSRGRADAPLALIGEQPGDVEDVRGAPFVGPAGVLLRDAVADAGIDETDIYLTNAVKHFKFEQRGKRRIHQKPGRVEVVACRPWLVAELDALRPKLLVLLGATAASSLLGPSFRVTRSRGELMPWPGAAPSPSEFRARPGCQVMATIHPSAVLRADDRDEAYTGLVADLKIAAKVIQAS